jgi:hypothetical protein
MLMSDKEACRTYYAAEWEIREEGVPSDEVTQEFLDAYEACA